MPRTCLACSSSERREIDKALATGESLRNISERFCISKASLNRHKSHVASTIAKAQERREEKLGDSIFDEMRRVLAKLWELPPEKQSDSIPFP
jgi:transposase